MTKNVAVIILNWNGEKLLREFLGSVVENTNPVIADVVVADNGSTDGSLAYVATTFPQVKIIRFAENYGYAEGYNRAIAQCADYRYCVLLNSDVQALPGWIEPLYDYLEKHQQVAACQPKLMSYTHPEMFEYAGASGGFIDCHGYPFCRGRVFDTVESDHGQYDDVTSIFWATGAALFIRSEVYLRAGGLDKDFFAHMEEIDLCWRIHRMGYDIKVIPQSSVRHLGGGSLPASNPRKTYLNFRNNLFLLYKNVPLRDNRRLLFIRRLYDTLALLMFLIKFDYQNVMAVFRAHRDFSKQCHRYSVPVDGENLLGRFPHSWRNIVVEYYLKGRKVF